MRTELDGEDPFEQASVVPEEMIQVYSLLTFQCAFALLSSSFCSVCDGSRHGVSRTFGTIEKKLF